MKKAFVSVACLLLSICSSGGKTHAGPPEKVVEIPIPAALVPHVRQAEEVGRFLYVQDKAAAAATDVLREKIGDLRKSNLGGYLPLRERDDNGRPKDSWMVLFFDQDKPPNTIHRVRVFEREGRQPKYQKMDPPVPLDEDLSILVHARQAAIKALPRIEQPLNPAIMPANVIGKKGILVYLLAGTTRPDVVVLGKHYRVLVDEKGKVQEVFAMSKSVLELESKPPDEGTKTAGLCITHLVTDWPMETHVFASLLHKIPLFVLTARGIWKVDGANIRLLKTKKTE